ncbi:hypothetical protein F2Q69_00015765 [Brassica cretica]|uniref:Uncharacterized protein n=1 Tax=Brassica cretica TaxID=69181 RepID=A0A8S9R135_BRACR|nr:hypothetical protein F2Q69_00015765 [Brassica cretica]
MVRFRDGYQEKSKSLEGRFWYSENWDNRLFQRDIHNEIQATKGISSGCYLQGIELWEHKWDTVNNGLCQGSKRGILVEQRGHGATNKDDYKDQARWSSPSIQDFGNLSKSEVYIWTSDHGRWIDSEDILMASNRRFPHSHEISSYLNESTVIGTDWVTVMENILFFIVLS